MAPVCRICDVPADWVRKCGEHAFGARGESPARDGNSHGCGSRNHAHSSTVADRELRTCDSWRNCGLWLDPSHLEIVTGPLSHKHTPIVGCSRRLEGIQFLTGYRLHEWNPIW